MGLRMVFMLRYYITIFLPCKEKNYGFLKVFCCLLRKSGGEISVPPLRILLAPLKGD